MSYTPPPARHRREPREVAPRGAPFGAADRPDPELHPPARRSRPSAADLPVTPPPLPEPIVDDEPELDWAQVGTFGAGILIGAMLGVGAALLYAPRSGAATRRAIRRRARFMGEDARDAWGDLGEELRDARRHALRALKQKRRALRRKVERRRWALADSVAGDRPDPTC